MFSSANQQQMQNNDDLNDESNNDRSNVQCNSLLYKILDENFTKSRDLILEVASYCSQFKLQNFFLSQDDVSRVLQNTTTQVVQALDDILDETSWTKRIQTLDKVSFKKGPITFLDSNLKLNQSTCQEEVEKELEHLGVDKDDIKINSVSVK